MYYDEEKLQQHAIAEGNQFNWHSREIDLVKWWLQQAEQMENLRTVDGEHLIVLEAGQRNDGPGPDIFRSRILLDDFELSGDVEMHIKAGDWYVHGHQNDARYHDVILHVIMDGHAGPDMPTLLVNHQWLGAGKCVSNRSIIKEELLAQAYLRFKTKHEHLKALERAGAGYSPLFLGMLEIIMAGAARHKQLHSAALMLGLQSWPDCRIWQGSNQSFSRDQGKGILLQVLMQNTHLFDSQKWSSIPRYSWNTWNPNFAQFRSIGLSINQCREWLVNVLAPHMGEQTGFGFWQGMPIFRHYGLERKMLQRLGISKIGTVAEQQGLLSWKNFYCDRGSCRNCPLTQYHHTLTHIN